MFQCLVSDIPADKIPLYQLPDREHLLVHGERGEFGVQSYIVCENFVCSPTVEILHSRPWQYAAESPGAGSDLGQLT